MNSTEKLKEEHKAVQLMLKILAKVCQKIEVKERVNSKHLEQILDFLIIFVDKCHHTKEEVLLFPQVAKMGIPQNTGPIAVMLNEHQQGRNYIEKMRNSLKNPKKFSLNAKKYINLLGQHIEKEDNILYPMIDTRLPQETQKWLIEQFDKIEEDKIGPGKHDELHKTLQQLKSIYLV